MNHLVSHHSGSTNNQQIQNKSSYSYPIYHHTIFLSQIISLSNVYTFILIILRQILSSVRGCTLSDTKENNMAHTHDEPIGVLGNIRQHSSSW